MRAQTQTQNTNRAQILTQAILYLESKTKSDEEEIATTFVDYSHSAYKNMPCLTLLVKNKAVTFLVDSGATESVITEKAFDTLPKLSGRFLKTLGVAGLPVVEKYTVPLSCYDLDEEKAFKH